MKQLLNEESARKGHKRERKAKIAPPPDDEAQSVRFIEIAHQLEANETSKSFEDALSIVASSTPKVGPPSRKDKT